MPGKKDTHAESIKEKVARHLRGADILVKDGAFKDAIVLIETALQLDPKNYYARSFLDRVRLQTAKTTKAGTASQELKKSQTAAADHKDEQISKLLMAADQFILTRKYKRAQQQIDKVFAVDPKNFYAKAYAKRVNELLRGSKKGAPSATLRPPATDKAAAVEATAAEGVRGKRATVSMYRELLKEMWFDGKMKEEELRKLKKVRDLLKITEEEHKDLEKQIQIDAYVEALRMAWKDGVISQNENDVLELMRQKFNITMEEHMSAEAKILWAKSTPRAKSTILLVDDEETFLHSFAANLRRHGYDVVTAESVEKALELLQKSIPSIIVADLIFGEGMTGIEFYQRVREDERLQNLPFLLISGISDEFVVRAGMRMGVDNFIQKPFDLELLLATIEGKLRA